MNLSCPIYSNKDEASLENAKEMLLETLLNDARILNNGIAKRNIGLYQHQAAIHSNL